MLSQAIAPLLQALQTAALDHKAAFHTPGHKRGQGISEQFTHWLGKSPFQADLPELPELDNLFAPERVILQAQELAAEAFGAEQTWFLANGTTCGTQAAVLATCNPGDKILLPRNAHQSAIAALILSGAVPVFIEPITDSVWGIAHSITANSVAAALNQHPDARAVLLVYPTYYGVCGEIEAIAHLTHQSNIPLLVDEAHGAHLAFHPQLPISALAAGADLTVQSTHKVLSSLTQSAMLHVQGDRIDRDRLGKALQMVQSTSPNYLLLASLDAARQQMATQGKALMSRTLALADQARASILEIPGLQVLQPMVGTEGIGDCDRTRLTIKVTELGLTGFEADTILHEQFSVTAELPALHHLMFILTLGNTESDIHQLVEAFRKLGKGVGSGEWGVGSGEWGVGSGEWGVGNGEWGVGNGQGGVENGGLLQGSISLPVLSPRQAFFAPTEAVTVQQAIDRISAEWVCPYPPGIPALIPGEVVTEGAIAHLQAVLEAGGVITGCSDSTLKTLRVVVP
jgi:arginine/lysine/ornithine decarboxylase